MRTAEHRENARTVEQSKRLLKRLPSTKWAALLLRTWFIASETRQNPHFTYADVRVAELAGGVLKPLVKDLPGAKADAGGNVVVTHGAYGGPGICGFELLDADGKRRFAISGSSARSLTRQIVAFRKGPDSATMSSGSKSNRQVLVVRRKAA
ncbi:MAG: hypothetical protein FJ276_33865, partial [Planctomycetes bacterium]|nr:hypothetical protein [Planctomycetota bacterium]